MSASGPNCAGMILLAQVAPSAESVSPELVWTQLPITPLTQTIIGFVNEYPFIGILLLLMFLDIIMGMLVAFSTKTVSSSISFRGMCKKASIVILIGMARAIQPLTGLPLAKLVSIFYIVTEVVSITEAAAGLGLPLPKALVEALVKLRSSNTAAPIVPVIPIPPVQVITRGPVSVRTQAATSRTARIEIPPPNDGGKTEA